MSGRAARLVRFAGRMTLAAIVCCVCAVIAVQFEGIVARNVALAHELSATRADVDALRARTEAQRRTIRRLSDPHGAVPEIHDRLHLVGPNEDAVFVRGATLPTATPDGWNGAP